MKKRLRTELNPASPGLNAAFAELSLPDLPAGPEPVTVHTAAAPQKLGRVVLRRETAHRGGKVVVVVSDFAAHFSDDQIDLLSRELRGACGCGGTRRGREIELQGEHVPKIRSLLEQRGFQAAGVH